MDYVKAEKSRAEAQLLV